MRPSLLFAACILLCTAATLCGAHTPKQQPLHNTAHSTLPLLQSSFIASPTYIAANQQVTCENTSTGATEYTWLVDGIARSTRPTFAFAFVAHGRHTISLIARNGGGSDTSHAIIHVGEGCYSAKNNVWYFGNNTGLNFHTTPPTVLHDGAIQTREGCSSIADDDGHLLFYTDGLSVWDSRHELMPGGTDIGGGKSSTQAALIIPNPSQRHIYYIVTTDDKENRYERGLRYSIVDMSANNGYGTVQQAAVALKRNTAEKLTAIQHANHRDTWILVHGMQSNEFLAYLVTPLGVSPTPVVSAVGDFYNGENDGLGAMKASHNGKHIAVANFGAHTLSLYPFNSATGIVSAAGSVVIPNIPFCYGVEFSPDDQKLYSSSYKYPYRLYQFDVSEPILEKIQASSVQLNPDVKQPLGALQLARDGKIYIAKENSSSLGVIDRPNFAGTSCNYRAQGVSIAPQLCSIGLPALPPSPTFFKPLLIEGPTSVCPFTSGVPYTLRNTLADSRPCQWLYKSKGTNMQLPASDVATFSFATSGTDTLVVWCESSANCPSISDTVFITVFQMPTSLLGNDTSLCEGQSVVLDAGPGFRSYVWNDGSTQQTLRATALGVYSVTVTSEQGCVASDTISVFTALPVPSFSLGEDTLLCPGSSLTLYATEGFQRYRWMDGSTTTTLVVSEPGLYWAEADDLCGSVFYDTVAVGYRNNPHWSVAETQFICPGESTTLFATGAVHYQWTPSDGLNDPTLSAPTATPKATTVYTVRGIDEYGCQHIDSVRVNVQSTLPVTFALPTLTAAPGAADVPIPLRVTMHPKALPFHVDTLRAVLRFRSSLLRITHPTDAAWTRTHDGAWEELHLALPNVTITTADTVIATLMGEVFLGDTIASPLLLRDITSDMCHTSVAQHGTLTLDSSALCQLSLRQVREFHPNQLHIAPNPAYEQPSITLTTAEQGVHAIALYNMQGILVWNTTLHIASAPSTQELAVPQGILRTGAYTIAVKTPQQTLTRIFVVQQ